MICIFSRTFGPDSSKTGFTCTHFRHQQSYNSLVLNWGDILFCQIKFWIHCFACCPPLSTVSIWILPNGFGDLGAPQKPHLFQLHSHSRLQYCSDKPPANSSEKSSNQVLFSPSHIDLINPVFPFGFLMLILSTVSYIAYFYQWIHVFCNNRFQWCHHIFNHSPYTYVV